MCKRPGFSDLYLQAFNRRNVTLVDTADTHGITALTETSIVVGEAEYEVDCIIFATGFDVGVSGVVSGTLPVSGRGGRALLEAWGMGPRTLHGFTTHGFPNLLQLGPMQNSNSVNFGSRTIGGLTYSPGPVAFHRLLREWRAGDMTKLLVVDDADECVRESSEIGVSA